MYYRYLYLNCLWGKDKEELVSLQNRNSFGVDSPFGYCLGKHVRQIILGTDYVHAMTFIHYVEYVCNVPYRFAKSFTGQYVTREGIEEQRTYDYPARKLEIEPKEIFNQMGRILEERGASRKIDISDHIRLNAKSTDLLYVLFTSGSTGVPKGVTLSHAAVIDFMDWVCEKYYLDDNTTLCNQAPFYFDASVPDLYIPLKTGATVYIPPKTYYTFPKKILQFIIEKEINTLVWVPSALCNVVNCRAFNVAVPTTIKLVIFCGEVMPCKHLNVWKKFIPDRCFFIVLKCPLNNFCISFNIFKIIICNKTDFSSSFR